jgi:hypothetical protein
MDKYTYTVVLKGSGATVSFEATGTQLVTRNGSKEEAPTTTLTLLRFWNGPVGQESNVAADFIVTEVAGFARKRLP